MVARIDEPKIRSSLTDRLELLELTGRVLKTEQGQSFINISEYPDGLYIVRTWLAGEVTPKSNLVTIMK